MIESFASASISVIDCPEPRRSPADTTHSQAAATRELRAGSAPEMPPVTVTVGDRYDDAFVAVEPDIGCPVCVLVRQAHRIVNRPTCARGKDQPGSRSSIASSKQPRPSGHGIQRIVPSPATRGRSSAVTQPPGSSLTAGIALSALRPVARQPAAAASRPEPSVNRNAVS